MMTRVTLTSFGAQAVVTCACAALLGAGLGAIGNAVLGWSGAMLWGAIVGVLLATMLRISSRRVCVSRRRRQIDRALPFVLDMVTLCVESGMGLHGALQQVVRHGPASPLREEIAQALTTMRAGVPRAMALQALADRSHSSAVRHWMAALLQAEGLGMSIGLLMREHAAQCRSDRLLQAEKLAMEAPVKMLLPLIVCIFPCTFIVLAFPIVMQMLAVAQ